MKRVLAFYKPYSRYVGYRSYLVYDIGRRNFLVVLTAIKGLFLEALFFSMMLWCREYEGVIMRFLDVRMNCLDSCGVKYVFYTLPCTLVQPAKSILV